MNEDRTREPKCWSEMNEIENPHEKQNWINVTKDEVDSCNENTTWDLVDVLPGHQNPRNNP